MSYCQDFPLFFFCHVPKAGGTTLIQACYKAFGFTNCLKVWPGGDVDPSSFQNLTSDAFKNQNAVLGHLHTSTFCTNPYVKEKFGNNRVILFSSVRDPLDRLVSEYNFIRNLPSHPIHTRLLNESLDQYINSAGVNVHYRHLRLKANSTADEIVSSFSLYKIQNSLDGLKNIIENTYRKKIDKIDVKNKTEDLKSISPIIGKEVLKTSFMEDFYRKHEIDKIVYDMAK